MGCVCSPSSPPGLPLGWCQGRGRQGVPRAAPCFGNVRGLKGGVQQQDQGMCLGSDLASDAGGPGSILPLAGRPLQAERGSSQPLPLLITSPLESPHPAPSTSAML